ncbi:MAG: DUF4340 domain-containing protein [Chloroflexota bacterium]
MSPRVTIGMLALLIALGVYVYFGPTTANAPTTSGGPGSPPGAASAPSTPDPTLQLWAVDEAQILAVTVQRGDQMAGVQRDGEEWQLVPTGAAADRLRVNSLVFRLSNVRATYRVPNPGPDSEFGLDTPSILASIRLASGESLELTIGAKAVAETGTYARKAGDPAVYLISNALVQDLERLVTEPPLPPSPTPLPSPAAEATPSPSP